MASAALECCGKSLGTVNAAVLEVKKAVKGTRMMCNSLAANLLPVVYNSAPLNPLHLLVLG
jgi:hypothetical protein